MQAVRQPITTPEEVAEADIGQASLRADERDEALAAVRRGQVYRFCPSAPGEPRRVLLVTTEAAVRRIWG